MIHIPVLLKEVLEYLKPGPGNKIIDATINGGGHAQAILERIGPGGKLLGIEIDSELFRHLNSKFKIQNSKFDATLVNDSYANLKKIAEENDFLNADGVLFDFGMSSWHLESGRGFTFQKDEPLDMRYRNANLQYPNSVSKALSEYAHPDRANAANEQTAEEIINKWSYGELVKILKEYGEERFAKNIAAAITKARKENQIKTTFQLVEIIKGAVPFWYRFGRRLHFATKTFQALRIAVNDEFENIKSGLAQAVEILKPGGRIVAISFHGLEDRIVKNFFRDNAKAGNLQILTKKPVMPSIAEIEANPRSRSARLRAAICTRHKYTNEDELHESRINL